MNPSKESAPPAALPSPTVLKGVLCRVGTPSEPDAITGYPRILISTDEESIQQVKHLPLLKQVVVIEESEYLRLVSAALPSPASAEAVGLPEAFRVAIFKAATDAAQVYRTSTPTALYAAAIEKIIRHYLTKASPVKGPSAAPQSQSKAEAVGTERIAELEGALGQLFGLVETGVLVRDTRDDGDKSIYLMQAMNLVRVLQTVRDVLAHPPATQNPPENAKGEELREAVVHLLVVLPMAKGYAAAHPVGNNQKMVDAAYEFVNRPTLSTREEGRT